MTASRFVIGFSPRAGDGSWRCEVRDGAGVVLDGSARALQSMTPDEEDARWTFPACHAPLADGAPDAAVLQALGPRQLGKWYGGLALGQPPQGTSKVLGRYLFELVLGAAVWKEITTRAGARPIELRVACPPAEWLLARLPWEMMHDGDHFLAARPGSLIVIAREITAPGNAPVRRPFSPRVLFVVGALIDDAEVRAGAECLGLLRRLQAIDLTLDYHVLNDATAETLADEMLGFRPSVVHFICHGGFADGHGSLRLLASDPGLPHQDYTAAQLLGLLGTPGAEGPEAEGQVVYPPVVVLNACFSATPPVPGDDELAPDSSPVLGNASGSLPTMPDTMPLGAELVAGDGRYGGPAVVVGMGGKVADLACRLFTRQFYQALLRGEPMSSAAAGRRGAFTYGSNPEDSPDWAAPVLFVEASAQCVVDADELDRATRRERVVTRFKPRADPTAFCDRQRFFEHWRELAGSRTSARRVLGISVSDLPRDAKFRLGRSRLLQELAVSAVLAGHVPCLRLHSEAAPERPADLAGIAREILVAALDSRTRFNLPPPAWRPQSVELQRHLKGQSAVLDPSVDANLPSEAAAIRQALALDLWHVRDDVSQVLVAQQASGADARAVVLLDDIHRYAAAAGRFVAQLLTADGLGTSEDPIPVVFTYRKEPNYPEPFEQVKQALDEVSNWAIREELQPLRDALTDRSIYLHLLLHRDPPIVPANDRRGKDLDPWFALIHDATGGGYPSQLQSSATELGVALRACLLAEVFVAGDDERVLQALAV